MKEVVKFVMAGCPHCRRATNIERELIARHPEYSDVQIETVDENEQADRANACDYYYVPTYYVGGVKIHEGVPSEEKIEAVFKAALAE
ncbi:MAG: thioredoxin family protein [Oscillospiraceae bacterium]